MSATSASRLHGRLDYFGVAIPERALQISFGGGKAGQVALALTRLTLRAQVNRAEMMLIESKGRQV